MPFTIILNGQIRNFERLPESPSLEDLIQELGLKSDRVAVEHNGEIVPRTNWTEALLNEGDKLELVHFVGGGTGV
jgi:thiamine biosynthesis protein ThiS